MAVYKIVQRGLLPGGFVGVVFGLSAVIALTNCWKQALEFVLVTAEASKKGKLCLSANARASSSLTSL